MHTQAFNEYLTGCRFCPMCKPFGEVSNLTHLEIHTTRIRAMLIWQVLNGMRSWSPETARSIFESTLDSVSQSWCIHKYPVADYILAARADIVEAGCAPEEVMRYQIPAPDQSFLGLIGTEGNGSTMIFYPGDALSARDAGSTNAALKLFRMSNEKVELPLEWMDSGALAYCLGLLDISQDQAARTAAMLNRSIHTYKAGRLVVDGPLTHWMLKTIYPKLDPGNKIQAPVISICDRIFDPRSLALKANGSEPLLVYALTSEFTRLMEGGSGIFRDMLSLVPGLQVIEPSDGLELADGSGAGGALHIPFPKLSSAVSKARVREAQLRHANCIVTDSPLDATHLTKEADLEMDLFTIVELMACLAEE
jgi:Fe-S oxidoreductase